MEPSSFLRENVRPMIALIIIVTLSASVILQIDPPAWYQKWGGIIVLSYFGLREWGKFVSRKKKP